MARPLRIFISVAEDSADVHAAALLRAAPDVLGHFTVAGLTGPRLRALGAETVADLTAHAAMLGGVFGVASRALAALRAVEQSWTRQRPDVLVVLDSPELHLGVPELRLRGMAPRARRRGIPVVYYIAPQTWASRPWRNAAIRRCVDTLACILPFEEAYFRSRAIDARFVGHPLFESLAREQPRPAMVARLRAGDAPLIALLPGSRRGVLRRVLPLQLAVLGRLRRPFRCAVSAVDAERAGEISGVLAASPQPPALRGTIEILTDENASLLSAADLVLVASGTATLHVAHYRKPMIVMYDAGPLLGGAYEYFGRRIVATPHLSLVNLLADRRVVPEFMPTVPDPAEVAAVADQLLSDHAWRELMIAQLDEVVRPLETGSASRGVCEIVRSVVNTT
ncbi:Glycosyl transferase [Phycisphaerae bacterium RAS1]|nr:Glycosyl transferase [Phycisphaerae bacterium RAS1]